MEAVRTLLLGATAMLVSSSVFGDIVINEFLVDDRAADSTRQHPSDREFVELYNSGVGAVNVGGWQIKTIEMGTRWNTLPGVTTYTIPANTMIPADGYLVLAHAANPDVDIPLTPALLNGSGAISGDLFPDGQTGTGVGGGTNANFVFELRDGSAVLQDAVGVDITFGVERARLTAEQLAFTGGGIWPDNIATEVPTGAPTFNTPATLSRYRDGVRTGGNGRDFGFLPTTPGTSNDLPFADSVPGGAADGIYIVPNVESLAVETPLGNAHGLYSSFVPAVVGEPHISDGNVVQKPTNVQPPVGTKALINYDLTGGGNVVQAKSLVNSFDIYTYIDTDDYNLVATHPGDPFFAEWTTYGIGTTDPFFASFDEADLIPGVTFTRNGNTGVGWAIEKVEANFAGTGIETRTILQLVNFGDGGDSVPDPLDPFPTWQIEAEFDLSDDPSAWHRLSIDYDPDTNMVMARFNDEVFEFEFSSSGLAGDFNLDGTVDAADYVVFQKTNEGSYEDFVENFGESGGGVGPSLIGTFYVGYRDGMDAATAPHQAGSHRHLELARPATWLQYAAPPGSGGGQVPEPGSIALVLVGLVGLALNRRGR